MTTTDMPTMSVRSLTRATDRDHYFLVAFDSPEELYQHIVIILPEVTEPTWVLSPGARKVTRSNTLALALPSLTALTPDLARQLSGMVTDFFGLYRWTRADREAGNLTRGDRVALPW